ncbi:hypothetical protein CR513_52965, partial [Mucuna pruriens]
MDLILEILSWLPVESLVRFRPPSFEKYLFYLWNPATRLISQISPSLVLYNPCVNKFGFGYDSLSDTYKVVAFIFECNYGDVSSAIEVKEYGIENSWTQLLRISNINIAFD